jgi:two-component system nitrogen regulation sensor histidine kinase NtrY
MLENLFAINIFIRVILISVNSFAFILIVTETNRPATTVFLGILLVYITGNLFYYVNRTNRELASFLIYLKENDTSLALKSRNLDRTFKGLRQSFRKITDELKKARIEKELKQRYIQTLVEHVGVGLISFDDDGKIEKINKAAKKLLNIPDIVNISELDKLHHGLAEKLKSQSPGLQSLLKIKINNELLHIAVKSTITIIENKKIKIISLQDIRNELEEKELDSWKQLISTLTHEIMNSITPITTLTVAIKRCFKNNGNIKALENISMENIKDAIDSTNIIEERSKGLISFVDKYRSITKLPVPVISRLPVAQLFNNVELLFKETIESYKIKFNKEIIPDNLHISADKKLMEQVLINLLKNSLDALKDNEKGVINIRAYAEHNNVNIQVIDNGPGIPDEVMENIFIPFYTTKEKGTGIGLSISRQIIRMHKGKLSVRSVPNKNTTVTICL